MGRGRPKKVVGLEVKKASEIPEDFKELIFDKPEYLDSLGARGVGYKGIGKLAQTLKVIGPNKVVKFDLIKFETEFGKAKNIKGKLNNIKTVLKTKFDIARPKAIFDNGMVFVWYAEV